jgi:Cu(I)/Ag(I) efflux system membrane fusion protein
MITAYLELKEALVASDPTAARKFAGQQLELLRGIPLDGPESHGQPVLTAIGESLEKIQGSGDLAVQRTHFKPLSEKMIVLAGSVQGLKTLLYVQHCPMADGNKGADWLSLEEAIANPYYGDQMLRCGKVTKMLR